MRLSCFTMILLAAGGAGHAQGIDPDTQIQALFETIDANSDGTITLEEINAFDELVMTSMDTDGSGGANVDEYMAWGIGFQAVAAAGNRGEAYETADRLLFNLIDYDHDGEITPEELDRFQEFAFDYADRDGEPGLSATEFRRNHPFNIAADVVFQPQ